MRHSTLAAIIVVAVLLLASGPSWCLPGPLLTPDLYAAPHPFSLPLNTSVRAFAMGNCQTAVLDDGFANPAYAGFLTESNWQLRTGTVDWEEGPNLHQLMGSVAFPINHDDPGEGGVQIALFRTSSTSAQVRAFQLSAVEMGETDLGIMYGRRMGRRFHWGVGISPIMNSELRITNPYMGNAVLLATQGQAKFTLGGRFGAAYDLSDKLRISALYDDYKEKVDASGLFVGPPVSLTFHNKQLVGGASYQLNPACTLVAEWQEYQLSGPMTERNHVSWHFGAEQLFPCGWALRAGANDGKLTAGLGCHTKDGLWRFDYTYLRDWAASDFQPFFGSSNSHMLMAERYF